MERKSIFYGTPLNRSLNSEQNNDTPNSTRKARLNQQQTVRDDHGRQRFHGAFTGGFSAGYYNTVDSTAGFQPRQFVSHRNKSRDEGCSSFTHNPEDYMDEEDLGEFGIAPRKVRISSKYTSNDSDPIGKISGRIPVQEHLKPRNLSVGEFILKNLCSDRSGLTISTLDSHKPTVKNDFHGLGYKSLDATFSHTNFLNPLTAVLKGGKRLKISGEAFGTGVMDDDEDCLTTNEAYGYDDLDNYDFNRGPKPQSNRRSKSSYDKVNDIGLVQDFYRIVGFISAKYDEKTLICDDIQNNYPLPIVPNDWTMPARSEVYVPPTNTAANSQQLNLKSHQSSSSFNKKFTPGFKTIETDNIETRRGLVLYSDLKAKSKASDNSDRAVLESQDIKASIVREEMEWRPCSLLCKHFNVSNPYPDNLYVGVKPRDSVEQHTPPTSAHEQTQSDKVNRQEPASMEIKQMIFNVTFTNYFADDKKEAIVIDKDDSEDDPQVVEVEDSLVRVDSEQIAQAFDSDDEDPDVLVVTAPKREPELIVLSSSSSESSPTSQQQQSRSLTQPVHRMHGSGGCHLLGEPSDSADTYGPPLPPTLRTLIDLDRRAGRHRIGSVQSHRKKKKHKKSKRNS